ncbi:DUF1007 family protein [Rhodophyticola sp. CCM32]|uniref:DUF1007 family protein n=1 Tax=Rhodophyticola sp. CCM32 TaxID=2916397 RepID=UPI001AEFD0B3|nr:DUF1007 family protein [Rhodophyticola sp. CCM32]
MAACLATAPLPGAAHPHIFIDAGLDLIHDAEGLLIAVQVTWRYDELYSLVLLQDYGLDPDFDGVLTEAEIAGTLGFDLNWAAGFEGGLVFSANGVPLEIGAPVPVSLSLSDGQLQTTHRRPVRGAPTDATEYEAAIYDPDFYIAFEMTLLMQVDGRDGCSSALLRPDLDAAYAILAAEIEEIGGAISAEDNFPAIGAVFADRVVFRCAAG